MELGEVQVPVSQLMFQLRKGCRFQGSLFFFQVTGLYFFQVTGFREGFQGLRDGITRKQLAHSTATSNELIQDSEK